jgi:hypothetical protein
MDYYIKKGWKRYAKSYRDVFFLVAGGGTVGKKG